MFKKKKVKININPILAAAIPYTNCYQEEGIIETIPGTYTKMYMISDLRPENLAAYDAKIEEDVVKKLLCAFPDNISFQFLVQNEIVDMDSYLKRILITPQSPELEDVTKEYNKVIWNTVDIGHNNIHKVAYFIIACNCDSVENAIEIFRNTDHIVRDKFDDIYSIEVKGLTLLARLNIMYNMFNPGKSGFGKKIDLKNDGNIDLNNLKFMRLSSKDIVAPDNWDFGTVRNPYINYSILNNGTENKIYTRSFFLNTMPNTLSHSMISDFASVASNMIVSIIYQPIDANIGFDYAANKVRDNTDVQVRIKDDTIEDRKSHTKTVIKNMKQETEKNYFESKALDEFKQTVANKSKDFLCTIAITLYASDTTEKIEEDGKMVLKNYGDGITKLDRDTNLLKISASKFACTIKCLDLQQKEGFQTSLPLCTSYINAARCFNADKLAKINPIDIQAVIKRNGMYMGTNAINGNLILMNRKNNINLTGMIAGAEHSGKTFQMKREIVNAIIGTNDKIYIVTDNDEYDDFAKEFGGQIINDFTSDIFLRVDGYGLIDKPQIFKSYFLDALFTAVLENKTNIDADKVEEEVVNFIKSVPDNEDPLQYLCDNKEIYPDIINVISQINPNYLIPVDNDSDIVTDNRITVYKIKNKVDMIVLMDKLWNMNIEDKKQNICDWVFIDKVDEMLYHTQDTYYLTEYINKMNQLKNVLTYIIGDSSTAFVADNEITSLTIKELCDNAGYIKLLSLSPLERKNYCEFLNIPGALLPYITSAGISKGIIITPAGDVAFDDSFLKSDPNKGISGNEKFQKLFEKEIEQIKF